MNTATDEYQLEETPDEYYRRAAKENFNHRLKKMCIFCGRFVVSLTGHRCVTQHKEGVTKMPKQAVEIEVDIPGGMEVDYFTQSPGARTAKLHLKEREPEFIEVRDFLIKFGTGTGTIVPGVIVKGYGDSAEQAEADPRFLRWVDKDWRRVYI